MCRACETKEHKTFKYTLDEILNLYKKQIIYITKLLLFIIVILTSKFAKTSRTIIK